MRKKIFLLFLVLMPSCVSNSGKTSDKIPTPLASKSEFLSTPKSIPITSSSIILDDIIKKTCLKFYIYPTPVPVVGVPDSVGDFTANRIPIKGIVYDKDKNPVQNVNIKMEVVSGFYRDMCVLAETKTDSYGAYIFVDSIYNTKVRITISKLGYKEISRLENINDRHSNLDIFSIIDFGGSNPQDANYFLEKL